MTPKKYQKVYVEISNVCNLQCHFCPEVVREKQFMDPPLFETIIKAIQPLTNEVCFHLMGEPLVHPQFTHYVKLCEREKLPVNITSNGVLLNDVRTEALLNSTVRQVNFSVHSFESNFPGKDITTYLEKLFTFVRAAFERRPDLYINFRLWNLENSSDGALTNKLVLEKINHEFSTNIKEVPDVGRKKGVRVINRFYLNFDSRFLWPHPSQEFRTTKGFCYGLESHFGILADGTVVPCCLDKEGEINLGNCTGRNIQDILNDERASQMTAGFKRFELIEKMCQSCTFISRFDKKALRQSGVHAPHVVVIS